MSAFAAQLDEYFDGNWQLMSSEEGKPFWNVIAATVYGRIAVRLRNRKKYIVEIAVETINDQDSYEWSLLNSKNGWTQSLAKRRRYTKTARLGDDSNRVLCEALKVLNIGQHQTICHPKPHISWEERAWTEWILFGNLVPALQTINDEMDQLVNECMSLSQEKKRVESSDELRAARLKRIVVEKSERARLLRVSRDNLHLAIRRTIELGITYGTPVPEHRYKQQ